MTKHVKQLLESVSVMSALLLTVIVTNNQPASADSKAKISPARQSVMMAKPVNQQLIKDKHHLIYHQSVKNSIKLGGFHGNHSHSVNHKRNVKLRHNHKVHYQHYLAKGKVNVNIKTSTKPTKLYSLPKGVKHSKLIGNTKDLDLTNHWIHANQVAYLKSHHVFYGFNNQSQYYWIPANNVSFNLKRLRGHNHRIERVLAAGEKLIGHSKYYGKGMGYDPRNKRFDCSEFIHWVFLHGGVYLGPNTWTQYREGRAVRASHMKRGDIFFFDDPKQGRLCHVGIYLGHHLFLHDSPDTNNGGVGVSSLNDPFWTPRFDHIVRRIL